MTLWGNTQGPVCHSRVSEAHSQGARLAQPLSHLHKQHWMWVSHSDMM